MNKPVAWISEYTLKHCLEGNFTDEIRATTTITTNCTIPLYTHLVKELHLSVQKSQDGELLAVTYTDDEHRIVEVLWEKPPVKELTDEEIMYELIKVKHTWVATTSVWFEFEKEELKKAIRAILRKAQEK